jgi:hypothetical protein
MSRTTILPIATWCSVAVCATMFACEESTPGPKSPTSPEAQDGGEHQEESSPPRHDGVYVAKGTGPDGSAVGWDYLRFLSDGQAFSISSPGTAESAVSLLYTESDKPATGSYEIRHGKLRFVLKSKLGTVSYEGAIHDDRLEVRWHSKINGATADQTYTFVPVQQEGAPEEAADASAPPSTADVIPPGSGWFCYHTGDTGADRCERTAAACEATRKSTDAAQNPKTTRCAARKTAFCLVATMKKTGSATPLCFPTQENCGAAATALEHSPDVPDITLSACEEK